MLPLQYLQSIQSIRPFVKKKSGGKLVQAVKAQNDSSNCQDEQDGRYCWF